jgi:hypothetical protein
MKKSLAVLASVALSLAVSSARCDQASAREAFAKEGIAFASGAKLGEHKAALIEAAKTPEMSAVLEAADEVEPHASSVVGKE